MIDVTEVMKMYVLVYTESILLKVIQGHYSKTIKIIILKKVVSLQISSNMVALH